VDLITQELLFDDGREAFSERIEAIDVRALSNDELRGLNAEKNRFVDDFEPMGKRPGPNATMDERMDWANRNSIYSGSTGRRCQLAVQKVVNEVHRRCTGGLMEWPALF
jgi:hypothetical protein